MKMLVVFSIRDRLKYIGHLDLMRAMQRALRRSGLPLSYSQGFNPHILLGFAAPLSVGSQGLREIMEVPLSAPCSPEDFLSALNAALPPLLQCVSAREVPDDYPAPMSRLAAASYLIRPLEHQEALLAALPGFLTQPSIVLPKKTKRGLQDSDIRPMIHRLAARDGQIDALLQQSPSGTCKPALLIAGLARYLDIPAPRCEIVRTGLYDAGLKPLEEA